MTIFFFFCSCLDVAVVKGSFIVCASDMMTKHDLVNGRLEITYENFTEPNYKPTVGNIDIYDNRIVVPISNKLKFWQLDSPKVCHFSCSESQKRITESHISFTSSLTMIVCVCVSVVVVDSL
jgi:hypothetical protein